MIHVVQDNGEPLRLHVTALWPRVYPPRVFHRPNRGERWPLRATRGRRWRTLARKPDKRWWLL